MSLSCGAASALSPLGASGFHDDDGVDDHDVAALSDTATSIDESQRAAAMKSLMATDDSEALRGRWAIG